MDSKGLTRERTARVPSLLAQGNGEVGGRCGVATGGRFSSGEWPTELFDQITDLLAEALVLDYQHGAKTPCVQVDSEPSPAHTLWTKSPLT